MMDETDKGKLIEQIADSGIDMIYGLRRDGLSERDIKDRTLAWAVGLAFIHNKELIDLVFDRMIEKTAVDDNETPTADIIIEQMNQEERR